MAMATKRQQHVLGLDLDPAEHPRLVLRQAQKVSDMRREEAHNSIIANPVAGVHRLTCSSRSTRRVRSDTSDESERANGLILQGAAWSSVRQACVSRTPPGRGDRGGLAHLAGLIAPGTFWAAADNSYG